MILCFSCSPELKEKLDALVALRGYRDYGDVLDAAIANLVLIENEVVKNGVVIIQCDSTKEHTESLGSAVVESTPKKTESNSTAKKPVSTVRKVKGKRPETKKASTTQNGRPSSEPELPVVNGVPVSFTLKAMPDTPPKKLANLPMDMWGKDQEVPLDRWILGQYNRLLPAKVNARGLIWMYGREGKPVDIAEVAATLSTEAVKLGDHLTRLDEKFQTARDDLFATAFPTSGDDEAKARARYANQFVVYKNSQGQLSGLMVALKLLSPARSGRCVIPTDLAWQFAMMPNPVLDGDEPQDGDKFYAKEREFLIDHILQSVPVEAYAYMSILAALRDGCNSPEKIDATLKASIPDVRAKELSKSYLASQRSGAISRMADLGLVEREREGVRVFYRATDVGLSFLEQCRPVRQ